MAIVIIAMRKVENSGDFKGMMDGEAQERSPCTRAEYKDMLVVEFSILICTKQILPNLR